MKRIIPLLLVALAACGHWKVSSYNSSRLCTLENGTEPGKVPLKFGDDGIFDLTFGVRVFGGRIYVTDNALRRLQVLERDGSPELVIGPKGAQAKGGDVKAASFNFSILGLLAADSDNNIYVQNRLTAGEGRNFSDDLDFSPSYVLMFDRNGALQYTLGKQGLPNIPFDFIEHMEVDRADRLFVVSRKFNTWNVSRFQERKLTFSSNFSNADFTEKSDGGAFEGRIDCVKVFREGENLLLSVAYYQGLRFKYRKIYNYSVREGKIIRAIVNLPDPKNELFAIMDDSRLYLWNIEERRTRFVVTNFDGNIIDNVLLKFDDKRYYFQDLMVDEGGSFYSYRVNRNSVDILEWK